MREALASAGSKAEVIELAETARTAADAAASLGVEQGAIVKPLVFAAQNKAVMALVRALVIDASLLRFETVYAAAGHPPCVFATSAGELAGLTGGALVEDIGVEGQGGPPRAC